MEMDKNEYRGVVTKEPAIDVYAISFNVDSVNEFYSR